ncbi:hypothetical protein TNCV_4858021 [Trichonephila clavipes]|nr:hypothetical protein TNCV_4858021 [Trichonephila clavipes]
MCCNDGALLLPTPVYLCLVRWIRAGGSLVARKQRTWLWGHCLLFGLVSSVTVVMEVIIDIKVPLRVTIDGACLTEETDALEDYERMTFNEQWWRDGQSVQMFERVVWRRYIQEGLGRAIVSSAPIGH